MAVHMISLVVALVGAMTHPSTAPSSVVPIPTPIGTGARYRLPAGGPATRQGAPIGRLACGPSRSDHHVAHVEVFARGRVLLIPPGVGIVAPIRSGAVVTGGRCWYPIWTDDPTGVVHMVRRSRPTLATLFSVWGQPLDSHRLCGFRGRQVVAYVDGRLWRGGVRRVPLRAHGEIVVEIGRRIAPHTSYLFPGAAA